VKLSGLNKVTAFRFVSTNKIKRLFRIIRTAVLVDKIAGIGVNKRSIRASAGRM
jgi:hypothetical protein